MYFLASSRPWPCWLSGVSYDPAAWGHCTEPPAAAWAVRECLLSASCKGSWLGLHDLTAWGAHTPRGERARGCHHPALCGEQRWEAKHLHLEPKAAQLCLLPEAFCFTAEKCVAGTKISVTAACIPHPPTNLVCQPAPKQLCQHKWGGKREGRSGQGPGCSRDCLNQLCQREVCVWKHRIRCQKMSSLRSHRPRLCPLLMERES